MNDFAFICVFAHSNPLLVGHVANLLEVAGIPVERRNQTLGGGAGELPPAECEPEVWVAPHNRDRAEALIHDALSGTDDRPAWTCSGCGERLEGVFEACWNCGRPKP
ncbi:DUF2007 domain-containing protein [Halomonas sp. THAF12]|uniref:putative signal transducing protein n=1 Tax=Halomonas sp. B23F22_10 TaxID=3459515 RepID=UPI00373E98C1